MAKWIVAAGVAACAAFGLFAFVSREAGPPLPPCIRSHAQTILVPVTVSIKPVIVTFVPTTQVVCDERAAA